MTVQLPTTDLVKIIYTNHHGATAERLIEPDHIQFTVTPYYPTSRWVLHAFDVSKNARRSFDMAKIQQWTSVGV